MQETCQKAGFGPAFARRGYPFGRGFGPGFRRPKYNVPINIEEKPDHFIVSVYASGFGKENIKLTVSDDVLYISGTRQPDDSYKPNFSRQEFPVRSFERMISLEGQVKANDISARQEDGVLYITLPKTEEAQKTERDIKVD